MRAALIISVGVALAAGFLAWAGPSAWAQYPPTIGSVSAAASDTTPDPGSSVDVTCTVLNSSGAPMANQPCTFSIASQPGGASFNGSPSTVANTNANGVATAALTTGTTPGTVLVNIESGGVSSQVTLTVGAPQQLPTTGGVPGSSGSAPLWPLMTGLIALALLAVAGALRAAKARRAASAG